MTGDIISKISDKLWISDLITKSENQAKAEEIADNLNSSTQQLNVSTGEENDGGFLKLKRANEWLLGDNNSVPMYKKMAAVSYMTGVFFGFLYFQLLCKYADNVSKENGPQIFTKKKSRKTGIRSQDLQYLFERSVKGSGFALSSPRLVIPAGIYELWELTQHFGHDIFDFQLVPAMVGLFAYKAAALVQVYRDSEDLQFIFHDNAGSSD